jgi:hypothetical protein
MLQSKVITTRVVVKVVFFTPKLNYSDSRYYSATVVWSVGTTTSANLS